MQAACKKVQELFKQTPQVLVEFNRVIPLKFRIQLPDITPTFHFAHRVKAETSEDPAVAVAFDEIIERWRKKKVSVEGVKNCVEKLLGHYRGLYEDFEIVFSSYIEEHSEEEHPSKRPKHGYDSDSESVPAWEKNVVGEIVEGGEQPEDQFFHRLRTILTLNSPHGFDYYNEFSRCLDLYTTCIIIKSEFMSLVEPLFEITDPCVFLSPSYKGSMKQVAREDTSELVVYLKKQMQGFLDTLKAIVSTREAPRRKSGWFFNPLSDVNTSAAKRHGHSYIQPTRPRTCCSGRTALLSECLNSQWVSVPYGSEDFSFREMRKNTYEEALFRVEDERFESDLAVAQINHAVQIFESELATIRSLSAERQRDYRLRKALLTPIKLKPIYIVYGEHAKKFEELLESDPIRTIPVVVARLRAKVEAWAATSKQDKECNWAETAEKNFAKSLDYRCFYFKQNEKKLANNRSFLTEAKARFDHRFASHKKLKEYITTKQCDCDYEFLGGAKNKLFYSSFAGMSYGIPHYLAADFRDELLVQSKKLQPEDKRAKWGNGRERGRLPQFRLLMNCQAVLSDAYRILLLAIEKASPQTKEKATKWLTALLTDFLGSPPVSAAVTPSPDSSPLPEDPKTPPKRPLADPEAPQSLPVSSMVIKRDVDFPDFLPLLEDSTLFYAPVSVYVFFRFLHTLYERLLKVKCILAQEYDDRTDEPQPAIPGGAYVYSEKVERDYALFVRTVGGLLKGTLDTSEYEDFCCKLFQSDAYVLFTFEKLVKNTVKSVTAVGQDELATRAYNLFAEYQKVTCGNEEMHLAGFCAMIRPLAAQSPFFRLLWDAKISVLAITYVENPYEKLSPPVIDQTTDYFRTFVGEHSDSQCPLAKELRPLMRKLDRHFALNQIGELAFARSVWASNGIKMGFSDGGLKLMFIPGGEDALYNIKAGRVISYVKTENCLYAFHDKNSFAEKMTEISQLSFAAWHAEWLSSRL